MRATIFCLVLLCTALSGCVSNTTPVPPCCYAGSVTTARFAALQLLGDDGRPMQLTKAFPGFTPQEGLFATALPFDEVERHDFTFGALEPLLATYDANGDGRLERPEVIVLYLREAALATGTAVRHIGGDTPVWAISAPNADVGGLVNWTRARTGSMNPRGQAIFRDLERLGLDLRTRGSEREDLEDWD